MYLFVIIVGKKIFNKIIIVLNAKLQIFIINALSVIFLIIAKNNLMGIYMENASVMMAIMMMAQIIYANNVLNFGLLYL